MKAHILYEALAALESVKTAEITNTASIPADVYWKVIQAASVLSAALQAQGLIVEVKK